MDLTYGLENPKNLYEKLKRDLDRLNQEVSSDAMFDFVVTGHHLREWIKKDKRMPGKIRRRLKVVEREREISICSDIANASKHFKLRPKTNVRKVESRRGFGHGRFGKGPFGHGEEVITIELDTGESFNALDFCKKVVELYRPLFEASQ